MHRFKNITCGLLLAGSVAFVGCSRSSTTDQTTAASPSPQLADRAASQQQAIANAAKQRDKERAASSSPAGVSPTP